MATLTDESELEATDGSSEKTKTTIDVKYDTSCPEWTREPRMTRSCRACGQACLKGDGALVRALGETYHYKCFICEDCHKLVASKFYALETKSDGVQRAMIVCEYHYYAHLGLICRHCDRPILGTVHADLRFHPECLRCPDCSEEDQGDPCFEFEGQAYCRYHFSLLRKTHCAGCDQAILKQFVEHHNYPSKKWHPECYMIQKFWNLRLAESYLSEDPTKMDPQRLIEVQTLFETKANRIWTDVSAFEESSATCISDMLLHVAAGAYIEGLRMAGQFVTHLEVLFSALDCINTALRDNGQVLECVTESKGVCNQITRFFHLLAHDERIHYSKTDACVTQELLSLVTGMAQNLKTLIRIGLTEALRLEGQYDVPDAVCRFLANLLLLEKKRVWMAGRYWFKDEPFQPSSDDTLAVDRCQRCFRSIDDECLKKGALRWHTSCFICTRCHKPLAKELQRARLGHSVPTASDQHPVLLCNICCTDKRNHHSDSQEPLFAHISRLEQYLDHVRAALARLYTMTHITVKVPDESTKKVMLHDYETRINTDANIGKRQSSLLRLMNRSTRRQSIFGSVHLTNVKRAKSKPYQDTCRESATTSRRVTSVRENSPSRLTSLRRALSGNRKERRPLYGVFNRRNSSLVILEQNQLSPQRASICTLDTSDRLQTVSTPVGPPSPDGSTSSTNNCRISELSTVQDAIVRHMAVLYVESLVRDHLSLDQLITMVETKRTSLWYRLKTHIRVGAHKQSSEAVSRSPTKTFGIPLATLAARDKSTGTSVPQCSSSMAPCFAPNALIPDIVQNCVLALLGMDMSLEGVFRKNGNIRELNEICEAIDQDNTSLEYLQESPIQLAALLKRYLRELPEPLLTFKLYDLLITSTRMDSEDKSKAILHLACCMLPKPNRDTMQLLFLFLKWVATFHDTNKMDVGNLARVIAPTVFYSPTASKELTEERQLGARQEIRVVEMLIRYQEEFCMIGTPRLGSIFA
ncbi:hypothetical protein BJV82DRAFT_58435 [Fennellomyces sp. T-0311]|nr:hypothetical protein BJV82DRAFT_58435 [Fennellomyces sp. T-0311]